MLILTYDEHGGFFDHVSPFRVKYRNSAYNVAFDSTGPRVPAIVAGPFAPLRVAKEPLDKTSILQLIAERFGNASLDVVKQGALKLSFNVRLKVDFPGSCVNSDGGLR